MDKETNRSPDMVRYDSVISIVTECASSFKSEKEMAKMLRYLSSLTKYDYKPVADNIVNNNTTLNIIAETAKVRQMLEDLKDNFR